jgi:O-6-methylguanine DNA methyltransferase
MIERTLLVLPGLYLYARGDKAELTASDWRLAPPTDGEHGSAVWIAPLEHWLDAWRDKRTAPLPPLAAPRGDWNAAVRQAMLAIPGGEVRTYGDLARWIGRPRAARAVAGACGRNPFSLLVPCHRVVAAGGIGGYSGHGGTATKRLLLRHEGAAFAALADAESAQPTLDLASRQA